MKSLKPLLWWVAIAATIVLAGGIIANLPQKAGAGFPEPPIGNPSVGTRPGEVGRGTPLVASRGFELAVFGQGCFWGVEERFRRVPGVVATAVGYTGGTEANPTYEKVSAGGTGHVEAVLVEFDPRRVSYEDLLAIFWVTHDATSGDRQGPDRGTQYRSAIFTFGPAQHAAAVASRAAEQAQLQDPITTQIAPAGPFWLAEANHQQYDEKQGRRSCPLPERARRK
jgi:peptide-methionine (S)-S-oxide reductase